VKASERRRATLAAAVLGLAAACASPVAHLDAGDPVTIEDLADLPAAVTPENARQVVRQCLQRHRRAASDVHRRYAYAFREGGFVQILHRTARDRGEKDRVSRLAVDFACIDAVERRTDFDWMMIRDEVRVTLRGRFRSWSSLVTPYRDPPPIGREPTTHDANTLVLTYPPSEAGTARRLVEALRILQPHPSGDETAGGLKRTGRDAD
jgi:hypothetical protein